MTNATLGFQTSNVTLRRPRTEVEGHEFLAFFEEAIRHADFTPMTADEVARRAKGRVVGRANNAIEGMHATKADDLIKEVIDRHAAPTGVAMQVLASTIQKHDDAFKRLHALYE